MQLKIIKGDLFASSDSLCHCVSRCLRMGKGIAKTFRSKFGNVKQLKEQNSDIGQVAKLKLSDTKFIYYLITKERYFHKPTYQDLEKSLCAMRDHMLANSVTKVSMPKIGCGLDNLDWTQVKQLLTQVFDDTNVEITVYMLK